MVTVSPGRAMRSDALPEVWLGEGRYRDTGCDLFAACLECPLPRCRYDVPGGARAMLSVLRDAEIVRRRAEGASPDELADAFGVSRRTVFRAAHGRPSRADAG